MLFKKFTAGKEVYGTDDPPPSEFDPEKGKIIYKDHKNRP